MRFEDKGKKFVDIKQKTEIRNNGFVIHDITWYYKLNLETGESKMDDKDNGQSDHFTSRGLFVYSPVFYY